MWWNVVHAKDSVLADLETTCDHVNVQTGWKLELCFMGESSPSPLAEVGMEHQSVSKKTSEGLSSQLALPMAPLNATSTSNAVMSDVENDTNSQPPDEKDGQTTPDGIGEKVF